ncbi:MAG: FHA domain-containing protein [Desulfatibacillaceae bacterium]
MPTLTLKFKDNVIREYELSKGDTLKIGRRQDNDIVVENLAVSGHHAKIDSVGDGYLLTDLQSKNGTFVNEKIVSTHWLKNGEVITIGKHSLLFALREGEAQTAGGGDMDQTMVMDTQQYRSMMAKSSSDSGSTQEVSPGTEPLGVLSFLSGGEGEYKLTKKLTKIGKTQANDIIVGGLMVGKTAATISRRPNGYHLAYVEGMAKPKINGEVVKESQKLEEFDQIEIGGVKMQFVLEKK